MLTKEQCQAAINARLEALVGQGVSVEASDFEGFECDVWVRATHRLNLEVSEGINRDRDGEIMGLSAYKAEVTKILEDEPQSKRNIEKLRAQLEPIDYCQQVTYPYDVGRKVSHKLECSDCGGKGFVLCGRCEGGKIKCSKCDGSGKSKVYKTYKEGLIFTKEHRIYFDCESCKGKGIFVCERCGGRGKMKCIGCDGRGDFVVSATFRAKVESEYFASVQNGNYAFDPATILPLDTPSALENLLGKPKRVNLAAESRAATEEYIFQNIPFARCVFRVGERDFEWKIYGEARNIAPSGDCVAVILQEKLEKFVAETTGAFFRFFALCRLSKEAKGFLRLPANEKILSAKKSEISRVALDCSVGEEYARSVILGTGRVAKAFVAQFFVLLLIAMSALSLCLGSAFSWLGVALILLGVFGVWLLLALVSLRVFLGKSGVKMRY